MNVVKQKLLRTLASLICAIAVVSVQATCPGNYYQPKTPERLRENVNHFV